MAKKYIPKLYDSDEVTLIDDIHDVIECKIREERNGIFELTLDYPASSPLLYEFKKERVIVTNASPKLRNQMFVIYKVCRYMKKKIKVIARHISFDLLYDSCSELKLENASCEYVLNSLFRNSRFSREFRGFSDIINAQNYSIENVNILEAIAGKEGSIIDTFGTGAEILRDNKNFHVLKKRGHDNGVSIEYGINLTGFECYEDTTDLVTCIRPFATYRNEDSTETTVRGDFVESPRAGNYKHLYIKHIDYTNKFEAKEVPTPSKLNELAAQDFRTSSMDVPKMRYEIKFIPLSQCVGYENFQDAIGLCDIVTVKNRVYNVDDKAKVVATVFDPIKDRYESMELGEPRSTLGSILSGSDGKDGQNGKDGKDGKDGQDGNVENMPDTLPKTPILYSKVYGMGGVELSWSFENKLYYNYELYASRIPDFNPTSFDLIHSGQSSSHFFKANPGETWYFRVCAINSHSKRTPFSNQVVITLPKAEDMNNYFSEMAIGRAVVQSLSADYMESGIIKANWVEFKGASIVDGNGKRTFDVDSFGRVTIMPSVFRLLIDGQEQEVATQNSVNDKISKGEAITDINITQGNIKIKANKIDLNGVTTAGNLPDGRYVKIENETYTAYNDNIKVLEQGVRNWSGRQVPAMYMGANGFKSGSTGTDGTYFAMFNFPSVNGNPAFQHLGLRNAKTGLWSVIEFNDQGVMSIRPEMNLNISGPEFHLMSTNVHFEGKTHFTQVIDARYINCTGMRAGGSVKFPFGAVFDDNGRTAIQKAPTGDDLGVLTTCLYPKFDAVQYLGNSSFRWRQLYCTTAPDISSDISLKENIEYTDEKSIIPQFINLVDAETITYRDMYEFYRDVYRSAEYNYIGSDEKVLGIIAQDMINTKVGDKIIRHNKDGKLSYSQETRVTVLEGALKEAINEIEYWKGKYIDLESKVDFIMEKLK